MNVNDLAMGAATDITTLLMPWITVLLSIIIALFIKDISTSIAKGVKFKMSKELYLKKLVTEDQFGDMFPMRGYNF